MGFIKRDGRYIDRDQLLQTSFRIVNLYSPHSCAELLRFSPWVGRSLRELNFRATLSHTRNMSHDYASCLLLPCSTELVRDIRYVILPSALEVK